MITKKGHKSRSLEAQNLDVSHTPVFMIFIHASDIGLDIASKQVKQRLFP